MIRRRPKYAIEPLKQKPFKLSCRYQCQLVASRALTLAGARPEYRPVKVNHWREVVNDTWCWALDRTAIVARSHDMTIVLATENSIRVNNREVEPFTMSKTQRLLSLKMSSKCAPLRGLENVATLALAQPVTAVWHSNRHKSLVCSINNEWFCPRCTRRFSTLQSFAAHTNLTPPVQLEKVWETSLSNPVGPVTRDWQQPGWACHDRDKHRHKALSSLIVKPR